MVAFLIDPEIRVRHRRHPVLRSIAEALDFARGMAAQHPDTAWENMVRSLERVRTEDDALEAAVKIEGLLEREAMLIQERETVPGIAAAPSYVPAQDRKPAGRAMSMVFATASAEPDR